MKDKIQFPTPHCLTAETIAMYVNGFLAGDELIEAEKHLKECNYCKEKVDKVKKDTKRFEQESGVADRVKSVAAIDNWVSTLPGKTSNIPEALIEPLRLIREDIISTIGKGVRTDERKSRRYQAHTGMIHLALDPESLEETIGVNGFADSKEDKFLAKEKEPDDPQVEKIKLDGDEFIRETYMAEEAFLRWNQKCERVER